MKSVRYPLKKSKKYFFTHLIIASIHSFLIDNNSYILSHWISGVISKRALSTDDSLFVGENPVPGK